MLPASSRPPRSLADTGDELISVLLGHRAHQPPTGNVAVVVIDGLGSRQLEDHSGHARFLTTQMRTLGEERFSGLPSTTASALPSITTGATAGQHGMVGYQIRDPRSQQLVNHLKPFPDAVNLEEWQPVPTIFERAHEQSLPAIAICEERFRGSDFTEVTLRGADIEGSSTLDDHLHLVRSFFDRTDRGFAYVYWPALDRMGHQHGVDSDVWRDALEKIDSFCRELSAMTSPDEYVVVTADHGMVDVDPAERQVIRAADSLRADVAMWAGEPRCVHLYLHDSADPAAWAGALQQTVGEGFRVRTRAELLAADVFGPVEPGHDQRIGDVVVFADRRATLYDEASASAQSLAMRGQHGSFTADEIHVPHIRLGQG